MMPTYYEQHREELKAKSRANYHANRERRRETHTKWRADNRDEHLRRRREEYHRTKTRADLKRLEPQTCPQCGVTFKPRNSKSIVCSRGCADARRSLAKKQCLGCGAEFSPTTDRRQFCSHECYRLVVKERRGNGPVVKCYTCGTEFPVSGKANKYCSPRCAQVDVQNQRSKAGKITRAEWDAILEYFNYTCAYCGRPDGMLTMDHVTPVSKGGQTVADNIVPACWECNKGKFTKNIIEFLFLYRKGRRGWEPKFPTPANR